MPESQTVMTTRAFPKIFALGNHMVADIFDDEVEITEKIDGSQIGWRWIGDNFVVRSHGREIYNEAIGLTCDDPMFIKAVDHLVSVKQTIPRGIMFYGECLCKPRQSTLTYNQTPLNYIALFGAQFDDESWTSWVNLRYFAALMHIDIAPLLVARGKTNAQQALELLDMESFLGGQKIEGIVVKSFKPWMPFGTIEYIKSAKIVSERFKETHREHWGYSNTSQGGLESLKQSIRTEARWRKAIQHLREDGEFTDDLRSIGPAIKRINVDIEEEEKEDLKEALWNLYRKDLLRAATNGFAEWYKLQLAQGKLQ